MRVRTGAVPILTMPQPGQSADNCFEGRGRGGEMPNAAKHLRIGIDGWPLARKTNGPGRHVFELCRRLDRLLPNADFFVYSPSPFVMPVMSERWISRVDCGPVFWRNKRSLWSKLRESVLVRRDHVDVFWAEAPFLPFFPRAIRTVVTVHDLRHQIIPEQMPVLSRNFYRAFFNRDLARATSITAVSQGTAQRLKEITGFAPDAIVRSTVAHTFHRRERPEINAVLEEFGIAQPYVLSVTSWLPNKNSELLVETFVQLKAEGMLTEYSLVIVGDGPGRFPCLEKFARSAFRPQIAAIGYVDDNRLAALYSGAKAFAFPSVYEGFGIPVAEARACGARVVTCDIPELREAGGECAIYVEPNRAGIRTGLLAAISCPSVRAEELLPWSWQQEAAKLALLLNGKDR